MEALHHPIGLRVVSCGGGCGDAQQPVKRSPKVGSELRPTVGGEVVRDAEPCDPVADESSDIRLCHRVCHRNCLRPACEAVHDCEEVDLVLRGREGANDVEMDTAEASVWRWSFNKRGMDVALDLRSLASMAFLTPAANVTLESMPDEAGGDGSLCWLASRMRETVDGLKDSSGPRRWKDRSVFSSGDIAEDSKLPERDVGEADSSRGGLVGSDFLRICLVVGQAAVVDRRESDRRQPGSTEQCVSDHICLALDVAHVGGELRDKGEMSGLPR